MRIGGGGETETGKGKGGQNKRNIPTPLFWHPKVGGVMKKIQYKGREKNGKKQRIKKLDYHTPITWLQELERNRGKEEQKRRQKWGRKDNPREGKRGKGFPFRVKKGATPPWKYKISTAACNDHADSARLHTTNVRRMSSSFSASSSSLKDGESVASSFFLITSFLWCLCFWLPSNGPWRSSPTAASWIPSRMQIVLAAVITTIRRSTGSKVWEVRRAGDQHH